MALTRVSPALFQVSNNITSVTVGGSANTISLTFDSNGVITGATNNAVSVANTAITGNIISSQIASVNGSVITANTIANSAIQTGAVENYMNAAGLGFGMRNRIINGAMVIDQRNAGASVTTATSGAYNLDRWNNNNNSGASRFTVQQNAGSVTPPAGFTNYLGCTSTGAYSIVSSDVILIRQTIEGFNIADFAWGTANAKTITVSFWVYSSLTGTFGGSLKAATAYSYPFTYTINSANTWEQKTITVVGPTAGTWNTGNTAGIEINFSMGTGSTYVGTPFSWAAADYRSATGATSVVGTNGATWYLTGVQIEKGSTATSFDYRPYGTELALCQRYFEKTYDIETAPATNTTTGRMNYSSSSEGNTNFVTDIDFKVTKRAAPTLTAYQTGGTAGSWTYERSGASGTNAVTFDLIGQSHVRAYVSIGVNWTVCYVYGHWTASAEL